MALLQDCIEYGRRVQDPVDPCKQVLLGEVIHAQQAQAEVNLEGLHAVIACAHAEWHSVNGMRLHGCRCLWMEAMGRGFVYTSMIVALSAGLVCTEAGVKLREVSNAGMKLLRHSLFYFKGRRDRPTGPSCPLYIPYVTYVRVLLGCCTQKKGRELRFWVR